MLSGNGYMYSNMQKCVYMYYHISVSMVIDYDPLYLKIEARESGNICCWCDRYKPTRIAVVHLHSGILCSCE